MSLGWLPTALWKLTLTCMYIYIGQSAIPVTCSYYSFLLQPVNETICNTKLIYWGWKAPDQLLELYAQRNSPLNRNRRQKHCNTVLIARTPSCDVPAYNTYCMNKSWCAANWAESFISVHISFWHFLLSFSICCHEWMNEWKTHFQPGD